MKEPIYDLRRMVECSNALAKIIEYCEKSMKSKFFDSVDDRLYFQRDIFRVKELSIILRSRT